MLLLDYLRVNNLLEFVNLRFQKKQKIKPEYFYPKNYRTHFPIVTPAARIPHLTRSPFPASQIFTSGAQQTECLRYRLCTGALQKDSVKRF
jgi:hypothetical protein